MRNLLLGAILLVGCGGSEPEPPPVPITYQVRCPLTTIETTADTVQATSFYYSDGNLKFFKRKEAARGLLGAYSPMVAQFPGTCVVKEIAE